MEHVERLNKERMTNIANENNVVYEYEYDVPERDADAAQVVKLAKLVFQERCMRADIEDEKAEAEIRELEILSQFYRTHPTIFCMMCDSKNNGRHYKMLCNLAKFKRESLGVGMSQAEATAKASEFILSQC